jgi:iron complex outermembrane recepter protein
VRIHFTGFSVCAALLSCLVVSASYAQSEDVIETREVVVSSTRLPDAPVDARTLPAKVTIITAEDIKKSGAKTVQEAIQWSTGVVMFDSIGNGFQQSIDLRGFNGQPVPSTSVFVDGVRVNEPDFNTVNFDLIPFDTIDRIEIIPGASAIYGKNALGGVINIITKRGGTKHQVTGETMFGSFRRERYTLSASGPLGDFDYYANAARETESGFRDDSGGRISRFNGRIGYRPSERTDLTLSYTYVADRLHQAGQIPLSVAEVSPKRNLTSGDVDDKEANFVRLTGRQTLLWGFSLNGNLFYRRLSQELLSVGQPGFVGGIFSRGTTLGDTESRGGTMQLGHEGSIVGLRNQLVIGSELIRNNFSSNLNSISDFGPFANRAGSEENILAFYGQDSLYLTPQLILTTGVRYDQSRITVDSISTDLFGTSQLNGTKSYYRTTPRAGLTYLVTPEISTYFNYSEGFRVPTSQEMFTLVGRPNPDLQAVRSQNYEFGIKGQVRQWIDASLAVFQNSSNEIFFTCTVCVFGASGFDAENRNADRSRRRGVEATLKGRWNDFVDTSINYTYTEAEFRSTFNLSTTKTVHTGDSIPLVPNHRVSMIANLHPIAGGTVSLIGLYVGPQFYLNDESNTQPRIPGYFVLNARIAYEQPVPYGRLTGFLMVNNMLNNQYFTFGSFSTNNLTGGGMQERFVVPAPGVAVYGGLSFRFEGN